jgi:hypothetical protein
MQPKSFIIIIWGGEQKNNKYTKNSLIWMLCRIALSPDFNCKPGRQLDKTLSLFW